MLDFEVVLGPFRLSLRLGEDTSPDLRPRGDVFSTIERAEEGPLVPEDRSRPVGFRGP